MKIITIALACLLTFSASAGPPAGSTRALGSPSAPMVIDLFSDFQCPHCKELHDEILPSLIADFVNTGKAYLVRHYFVLKFPYSRLAATYAYGAEKIGKYDQVSDALFRTQQIWGKTGNVDEAVSAVLSPADAQKVRTLAKDPATTIEIDKDTVIGTVQNVRETPTMIIVYKGKHTPIAGVISYSLLKMYLDKVLSQ